MLLLLLVSATSFAQHFGRNRLGSSHLFICIAGQEEKRPQVPAWRAAWTQMCGMPLADSYQHSEMRQL